MKKKQANEIVKAYLKIENTGKRTRTMKEIRSNWYEAFNTMSITEIENVIEWGLSAQDLIIFMFLHQNANSTIKNRIELLLTACNFHTFREYLHNHDYEAAEQEILSEYDYFA